MTGKQQIQVIEAFLKLINGDDQNPGLVGTIRFSGNEIARSINSLADAIRVLTPKA